MSRRVSGAVCAERASEIGEEVNGHDGVRSVNSTAEVSGNDERVQGIEMLSYECYGR